MRMYSMAVLAVIGVAIGATLMDRPAATALANAEGYQPVSISIDQLTTDAKDLPLQSFDAI
jgi:hypothetical protein